MCISQVQNDFNGFCFKFCSMTFHLGADFIDRAILSKRSCSGRRPVQNEFQSNLDCSMPNLCLYSIDGLCKYAYS